MQTRHRRYRQSDDLYDLIGALAATLKTSRTTVVELAVHALAAEVARRPRHYAERAREVDEGKLAAVAQTALEGRIRAGLASPESLREAVKL